MFGFNCEFIVIYDFNLIMSVMLKDDEKSLTRPVSVWVQCEFLVLLSIASAQSVSLFV